MWQATRPKRQLLESTLEMILNGTANNTIAAAILQATFIRDTAQSVPAQYYYQLTLTAQNQS